MSLLLIASLFNAKFTIALPMPNWFNKQLNETEQIQSTWSDLMWLGIEILTHSDCEEEIEFTIDNDPIKFPRKSIEEWIKYGYQNGEDLEDFREVYTAEELIDRVCPPND
jgi:hypothetical protein